MIQKKILVICIILSIFFLVYIVNKGLEKFEVDIEYSKIFPGKSQKLNTSQLQNNLDKAVNNLKIPGAVVYISGKKGTWVGASGFSNLESQTPMKPNDTFSLASASKTFVAVAVLQLVEQGKINLDKCINNYLPQDINQNIPYSNKITVRQLLNHTSGVVEYYDDKFHQITYNRNRSQIWTATEAIRLIYGRQPKNPPVKEFQYCDSNYLLLEIIIEQTTGKPLAEVIREQILNPLDLQSTFTELREPEFQVTTTGYSNIDNDEDEVISHKNLNEGNGLGDGGLISNASDVGKFLRALLAEKKLLSPRMLEEMLDFVPVKKDNDYGLGIASFETPFGKSIGHSGWSYGFVSLMLYFPNKDMTVVVLANKHQNVTQKIMKRVLSKTMQGVEIF